MASVRSITFTLGIALAASSALAQTPPPELTAAQTEVACAPAPILGVVPADAPFVTGNQDTVTRSLVGDNNQLVISAGTDRGVQFNQRYFVRRIYRTADDSRSKEPHMVTTSGWLHITAVNKTMALAAIDHTCSHILEGDFLEPFHAPNVPANIAVAETTGELNFKAYGRVLYGQSERWIAGPGDFMLIDRGADNNVSVGSHFAIYRDREVTGLPQTPIGEATAVSVGPTLSVVRITQARDAVSARDVVVPRGPARAGGSGAAPGWQTSESGGATDTPDPTAGPGGYRHRGVVGIWPADGRRLDAGSLRSPQGSRQPRSATATASTGYLPGRAIGVLDSAGRRLDAGRNFRRRLLAGRIGHPPVDRIRQPDGRQRASGDERAS
jgi:hypothetical protein